MYATGGRGGDVYYVTNLNDLGLGSLRYGIDTAPANGRTILFKVGGTINLQSNLTITRPKLTIAGQSAPGGGITIAGRRTSIYNTHDVVLQNLRFRVGDVVTRTTDPTYEPDALWVQGSSNVMIDHVSASWSVDEVLSVTDNSNNVTVQWSYITEALKDAGHASGEHSYGSLINGANISFHHNLYADNDSRNPRAQGNANTTLYFDFVNNVIQNPGGRYGYSGTGDTLHMNFVNNYGIHGPSTTNGASLFEPDSANTSVYFSGNYRDSNKNGVLDGTPATGTALVDGAYTSSPTRFSNGGALPEIATVSARQAYIQTLSRGGNSKFRDPVDLRIVRQVINQAGKLIDSQNEVGGWPALPAGVADPDANNDGIPEAWAIANGLNPAQNNSQVYAPNGYTYLENYLQSLTPRALPSANLAPFTISTADGRGADAQVDENRNDGGIVSSAGNGTAASLNARWAGASGTRNEYSLLRFDLAKIEAGSIADAALDLTAFRAASGTEQIKVYGLVHDVANWDWDEQSVVFADAPGLSYDANPGTRGLIADQMYNLGVLTLTGASEGQTVRFDNPNLAVFLNLSTYFAGTPEAGVVTLILERSNSGGNQSRFASKEATGLESDALGEFPAGTFAPKLVLTALEASFLESDFDRNGVVDSNDLAVWRGHFGASGATQSQGDANGDQVIDGADFLVWQRQFQGVQSQQPSTSLIPEPTAMTLALIAGSCRAAWAAAAGGACGSKRSRELRRN